MLRTCSSKILLYSSVCNYAFLDYKEFATVIIIKFSKKSL